MPEKVNTPPNSVVWAMQKIIEKVQPCTIAEHTDTWNTQKFVTLIEDFTTCAIDKNELVALLKQYNYQCEYFLGHGIEWYVKIVE